MTALQQAILEVLARRNPCTSREIANELKLPRYPVHASCTWLARKHHIRAAVVMRGDKPVSGWKPLTD